MSKSETDPIRSRSDAEQVAGSLLSTNPNNQTIDFEAVRRQKNDQTKETFVNLMVNDAKELLNTPLGKLMRAQGLQYIFLARYLQTLTNENTWQPWIASRYSERDVDAINQVRECMQNNALVVARHFSSSPNFREDYPDAEKFYLGHYRKYAENLVNESRTDEVPQPSYVPEDNNTSVPVQNLNSDDPLDTPAHPETDPNQQRIFIRIVAPPTGPMNQSNAPINPFAPAVLPEDPTRPNPVVRIAPLFPPAPMIVPPDSQPIATPVLPDYRLEDVKIDKGSDFDGDRLTLKNKKHLKGPLGIEPIYEREYDIESRIATYYKYILFVETESKNLTIRELLEEGKLSGRSIQALVFFLDKQDRFRLPALQDVLKRNSFGFGNSLVEQSLSLNKKARSERLAALREFNNGPLMRVMAVATEAEIKEFTELSLIPQEDIQAINALRTRLMEHIMVRYHAPATATVARYAIRDRSIKDSQKLVFKQVNGRKTKPIEILVARIYGTPFSANQQIVSKENRGLRVAYNANLDAIAHRTSMYLFGTPAPTNAQMPTLITLVDLLDKTISSIDRIPASIVVLREAIARILTNAEFKDAKGNRVPQGQSRYFEEYVPLPSPGEVISASVNRIKICLAVITIRPLRRVKRSASRKIAWIKSRPHAIISHRERIRAAKEAAERAKHF